MDASEGARVDEILQYWFGDLDGPHDFDPSKNALWWAGGEELDAEIRERFGDLVKRALADELEHWKREPRSCLALVILLDQFTRNLGRGTPRAFAGDEKARRVTEHALEQGHDQALRTVERGFLCMPLMHAEDRDAARRSLEVFEQIHQEVVRAGVEKHPDFHAAAKTHADIVLRFGRYPHRNEILGRSSTDEERAFLEGGGPSFGQQKK